MKKQEGFTLIEVIVSMLLLTMLFLSMIMLYAVRLDRLKTGAEARTTASNLAEKILEEYRNMDFDEIEIGDTASITDPDMHLKYSVSVDGFISEVEEDGTASLIEENDNPTIKRVTVTVESTEGEELNLSDLIMK